MCPTSPAPRILVLGLGNTLLGDEGLGVRAMERLHARVGGTGADITWMDGGTMGLEALPYIEACTHLLVLDAVQTGDPPGSLVRLVGEEIPAGIALKLSMHQVALADALHVARLRGTLPATRVLWGLTPAVIDWGEAFSDAVSEAIEALVSAAERELREWC